MSEEHPKVARRMLMERRLMTFSACSGLVLGLAGAVMAVYTQDYNRFSMTMLSGLMLLGIPMGYKMHMQSVIEALKEGATIEYVPSPKRRFGLLF